MRFPVELEPEVLAIKSFTRVVRQTRLLQIIGAYQNVKEDSTLQSHDPRF